MKSKPIASPSTGSQNQRLMRPPNRLNFALQTCLATFLLLVASQFAFSDEFREWSDATGQFKKIAMFLRLEDGSVFIRLENGSERRIPLAKLSQADQDYVRATTDRSVASDPFESMSPEGTGAANAASSAQRIDPRLAPPGLKIVMVEGVGTDAASAKNDAYREAVRQVVGAFVDSTVIVAQDELIEDKVITLSSAFVEKSEPIKETQEGGLVRVRLRAHVRIAKLLDSLRSNKISTLQVDAESLVGQAVTKADQAEGMQQLVGKALAGLQKVSLRATAEGKPEVKAAGDAEAELTFWLRVEPQLDAYLAAAAKLDAALSASDRPSGELVSSGTSLSNGEDYRKHLKGIADTLGRYWLPEIFVSELDAKKIRSSASREEVSPLAKCSPVYVFSEATASPSNWGYGVYLLQENVWGKLAGNEGDLVVMLLVHSSKTGANTRWKWFRLTAEEADQWVGDLKATIKATAVFKDREGGEVARDTVLLRNVGVRLLKRNAIAVSPFFMLTDDLSHYVPSLGIERTVSLTKEEVAAVDRIEAFIEEGAPLKIPGR
jgi:hypothetical protein